MKHCNKNLKRRNVQKIGLKSEKLDKIMELFYEYPNKKFTIRDIEKKTKIPRATVHEYINFLKKQKIITKENVAKEDRLFKIRKINYFIEKIESSGLIEEIIDKMSPSCVILFGSIRKGESVRESDIDLFIEVSIKKQISASKFERRLKHKIQLFIENDIKNLQPNLFNNVINGIKLYGSFKAK